MSFILDALKKSEHERQRQSIPGLVESGAARPRPRLPVWAIALCALLGINLLVLMVVLMRGWMIAPGATPPATLPTVSMAPGNTPSDGRDASGAGPPAAERPFSPLDPQPVYAEEIPVSAAPAPAAPPLTAPATRGNGGMGGSSIGAHALRRHDPQLNDDDFKPDDDEVLPSINELSLTGAQALPELHLDVHVFATRSTERFVFINMRKYHEGATLQEGPTIERIRRDGVILDYHGLRFLLPRQ